MKIKMVFRILVKLIVSCFLLTAPLMAEDALFIDAAGRVGIGTESPTSKLVVNKGMIRVKSNDDNYGGINLERQSLDEDHIRWSLSTRKDNEDLWIHAYDGTTYKNFLKFDWDGDVTFGVGNVKIGSTSGSGVTSRYLAFSNAYNDGTTANKIKLYNSSSWVGGFGISSGDVDIFSGGNFRFMTGSSQSSVGTERFTITKSGNVGIGTSSPDAKFNVQGGSDVALSGGGFIVAGDLSGYNIGIDNNEIMARNNGSTSTLYIQIDGGTTRFNGNVGIGRSPSYALDVVGTIRVNTSTWTSDERLKKNIKNIDNAFEKISNIKGVRYEWKDSSLGEREHFGMLAAEMEAVFPELVYTDEDGYKSVDYVGMIAPMIEAMKELKNENDDLKSRLEKIESLLNTMKF